jgi:hypothetical protein
VSAPRVYRQVFRETAELMCRHFAAGFEPRSVANRMNVSYTSARDLKKLWVEWTTDGRKPQAAPWLPFPPSGDPNHRDAVDLRRLREVVAVHAQNFLIEDKEAHEATRQAGDLRGWVERHEILKSARDRAANAVARRPNKQRVTGD